MASSSPSIDEAFANYFANVGYDAGEGDVTMAQNFVEACRVLSLLLTGDSAFEGARTTNAANLVEIRRNMERAQLWLQARSGSAAGSAGFVSFRDFRN